MRKVILVIMDGWGHRSQREKNAILAARTPNFNRLNKGYPHTLLSCAGPAVGLPKGYEGNSEVGHLTIGSGRITLEPMVRINNAIESGEFFKNRAFLKAVENCKRNKSRMHLIGLLQSEGVHSHENHLFALLKLCKQHKLKDVVVHAVFDGRDAPPKQGIRHLRRLLKKIAAVGVGRVATISGRYYAMDRDKRWKRTKKAYDCIVRAKAEEEFVRPEKALLKCYSKCEIDEFIKPRKAKWYKGVRAKDSIVFFNFRTDRPRQLTKAIVEPKFIGWKRKPLNVFFVAMTEYYKPMKAVFAFKDQPIKNLLGDVLSRKGIRQLRISETEKYAHVTFFLNGQREKASKHEERILVGSPRVATYDLQPEMSAFEVTRRLVKEIEKSKYGFIAVNLVNGDLVGHTGKWKASIKAAETVDKCIGKIVDAGLGKGYALLITADHGNLEDQTREWNTSHTGNKVPFILVAREKGLRKRRLRENAGLQDIAPTVLQLMGIGKPKEMQGKSLLQQ